MDQISLYFSHEFPRGNGSEYRIAEPMKFTLVDKNELCSQPNEPTLRIKPNEAQMFMDELWRAGIRPTEGAGSVGQMAATEKHLDDMRSLVFKRKG